jgi:hypothetical protein
VISEKVNYFIFPAFEIHSSLCSFPRDAEALDREWRDGVVKNYTAVDCVFGTCMVGYSVLQFSPVGLAMGTRWTK